jgi:bifunctional non-homologous end joining protein LigD
VTVPRFEPMLATSWPAPFSDDEWFFEPKWDGVRAIVTFDGALTSIRSRRGNEVADRYPAFAVPLPAPCVIDGEIVALDGGRPSFQRLQNREGPLTLVVFDLLWLDGRDLTTLPLEARLERLDGIDLPDGFTASEAVAGDGMALWAAVAERDLEGMVAKRSGSPYRPGIRSADWRKMHHRHTAKAVVGGFTPGEGGRGGSFGALVLGQWDGDALRWIGNVGTGFDEAAIRAIRGALDAMTAERSPFLADPDLPPAGWVEPVLVAAVEYRNWTDAGRLRFPVFKGFTDDDPRAITTEAEGPA